MPPSLFRKWERGGGMASQQNSVTRARRKQPYLRLHSNYPNMGFDSSHQVDVASNGDGKRFEHGRKMGSVVTHANNRNVKGRPTGACSHSRSAVFHASG
jgi:hypothetical protein